MSGGSGASRTGSKSMGMKACSVFRAVVKPLGRVLLSPCAAQGFDPDFGDRYAKRGVQEHARTQADLTREISPDDAAVSRSLILMAFQLAVEAAIAYRVIRNAT